MAKKSKHRKPYLLDFGSPSAPGLLDLRADILREINKRRAEHRKPRSEADVKRAQRTPRWQTELLRLGFAEADVGLINDVLARSQMKAAISKSAQSLFDTGTRPPRSGEGQRRLKLRAATRLRGLNLQTLIAAFCDEVTELRESQRVSTALLTNEPLFKATMARLRPRTGLRSISEDLADREVRLRDALRSGRSLGAQSKANRAADRHGARIGAIDAAIDEFVRKYGELPSETNVYRSSLRHKEVNYKNERTRTEYAEGQTLRLIASRLAMRRSR